MKNTIEMSGKVIKFFTMFIMMFFLISMIGCESESDKKEKDNNDKKEKEGKKEVKELPDWFLNPPVAQDVLYATGYAKKKSMQLALDSATDWARQELARIISVKVSTMTKQFLEEAGVDDSSQATEFTSVVSKSIASNVISGSKTKQREIKAVGDRFAAYVLVELSLADMAATIEDVVRANNANYAKLQANRAFEDLANELKKLKSEDMEKPKKPDYEE